MRKWFNPLLKIVFSTFLLGTIFFVFIIKTDCFNTDKKTGLFIAKKITDKTGLEIDFDKMKISIFNKPNIQISHLTILDKNLRLLRAEDLSINFGTPFKISMKDFFQDLLNKNLLIESISSSKLTISLPAKKISLINTKLYFTNQYLFQNGKFAIPFKSKFKIDSDRLFLSNSTTKNIELEAENINLMAQLDILKLKGEIIFSSTQIKHQKKDHSDFNLKNFNGDIKLEKNRLEIKLIGEENIKDKFIFDASILIGFSLFNPKPLQIETIRVNKFITKSLQIDQERFLEKLLQL